MLGAFWTEASERRNRLTSKYEPIQPFVLVALARRLGCDAFIDVGANIGFYSILMALSGTVREVHAFEASNGAFGELKANIAMNALINTRAHHMAVSDRSGEVDLLVQDPLSGINAVRDTTFHNPTLYSRTEKVGATTLDDFFNWSKRHLAIKIDVEGHEPNVIRGATRLLAHNTCVLQLECYGPALARVTEQLGTLGYHQLIALGHDIYFVRDGALTCADTVAMLEDAASTLIQCSLGRWPVHTGSKDALQVRVTRYGGTVRVDCRPRKDFFDGPAEFAFYLRKNGQKVQVVWYSPKASAAFELPATDEPTKYSISAFCRDKRFPAKKVMVTVPIT